MTADQVLVFVVLALALAFFVWNRWRYDLVAMAALLVLGVLGIVPERELFSGFAHPAVITVAAVLVVSRGLVGAGVVDGVAQYLTRAGGSATAQVLALTGLVAICSAFMNNVGALALFMPVAIWMSRRSGRSPSLLLMPLAFGSLLGGTMTLIGTPPNIIVSAYREESVGRGFEMFSFLPLGLAVTAAGILFIGLGGWRMIPQRRDQRSGEELFQIANYLSELRVSDDSKWAGRTLHELFASVAKDLDVVLVALLRGDRRLLAPPMFTVIRSGDALLIEADPENIAGFAERTGLTLMRGRHDQSNLGSSDVVLMETIVTPESRMVGQTAGSLGLRNRHGVNLLAVARQGRQLRQRLRDVRFVAADILLVQIPRERQHDALQSLGLLPLAERGLKMRVGRRTVPALGLFAGAVALVATGVFSAEVALTMAALGMVLTGILTPSDAYRSIDWPVIVLLAAFIPVGEALESTGGAELLAGQLLHVAGAVPPLATVALLLGSTMLLSNVVNNAAAAILMSPIAIGLARGLEISVDPMLMAVAIGASSAFLTPIGHQSNTLVMAPGGYRFGDYWRMGLPVSLIVLVTGVLLIPLIWPL